MDTKDKYWDKFCKDGKIESYLSYKQNQYKQEYSNGSNANNDRLPNYKGNEYR